MTDPRARAVLSYTAHPRRLFHIRLACRHTVRRRYALKPPPRIICPHCPANGGLGNSDFHAGRIKTRARLGLARTIETLTAISKCRALTDAESLLLEREICLADGRRFPPGLTRALAAHGIKRDMRHFPSSRAAKVLHDALAGAV